MPKFADTSYFLIDHYLDTINIKLEEDIKSEIVNMWPVIFSDWDEIVYQDYNDVIWNFEYDKIEGPYSKKQVDWSYDGSYLMGQNKGIIARGGRIIQLFVKDDDFGFREINVTPPIDNYKNGNFFNFHKHINLQYQYGSTLTETISGNNYYFEVYTPTITFDPNDINGKEVYFRKDSQFHNWLINYAKDYFIDLWNENFVIRNYVNTDKQFMYFGNIYHKKDNEYHIEFYGMKDFVMKSIPYHQRTVNLTEFMNVGFDRVYQEVYNLIKNIWSMIDPYEVDEKFLAYIAKFYNINVDNQVIDILNQREFIRELPQYLKRKGSYSSFYAAWKVLTQGTNNELMIYEKWLKKDNVSSLSMSPSGSDFIEIPYINQYNDTQTFALSGSSENYILSPYYKIRLDISTEPIEYESILSQGVIDSLLYQWEYLRPVNKVSEYEIYLAPEVGLTGDMMALYAGDQDRYNTNVLSKVLKFSVSVKNAYIQVFGGGYSSFLINHNLNSNHLFIRCYDMSFNEIVPDEVLFIDSDNIRVNFFEPVIGFMLVKKPDLTLLQLSELNNTWMIKNPFMQKELYVEFNVNDEKVYADENILINEEFLSTSLRKGAANISKPDLVWLSDGNSNTWTINHQLGYKGVLISCFDINNNEIIPEKIKFIDINNCIITFDHIVEGGYAILVSVGNPLFADMLLEEIEVNGETKLVLPYYDISSIIDNFETLDYTSRVTSSYETDDALFLIIDLPQDMELIIREIRIHDSNENILIYTKCGEIYKPMNVKMRIKYKVNKYTIKGSL